MSFVSLTERPSQNTPNNQTKGKSYCWVGRNMTGWREKARESKKREGLSGKAGLAVTLQG